MAKDLRNAETTWKADVKMPAFPKLTGMRSADVCIIGAGLTGVLTAYHLAQMGKKVIVLEKEKVGAGATGVTTGFLTQAIDTDIQDLVEMLGEKDAKIVLDSHGKATDIIETIVKEERIDCEFVRCDNTLYAVSEQEAEGLREQYEAAKKLGADVEFVEHPSMGFDAVAALIFHNQAKYHAMKFLAGAALAAKKAGVEIYANSEVVDIDRGEPFTVKTKTGSVTADWAISASYQPFNQPAGLFLKKAMYLSYIYELSIPAGRIQEGMYEDCDNPYHYFRIDPLDKKKDRVIVGGEDHREDVPVDQSKNLQALSSYVAKTFRDIPYKKVREWAGGVLEPIDGLAFIGHYGHDRMLYAFGFSGSGMTYAPIASEILSHMVMGKEHPWKQVYEASRVPGGKALLIKGRDYSEEFFRGAAGNAFTYRKK